MGEMNAITAPEVSINLFSQFVKTREESIQEAISV